MLTLDGEAQALFHHSDDTTVWVHQANVDRGESSHGELTTDERQELQQLRREVKHLRMEREILKKAAAFFAKENA